MADTTTTDEQALIRAAQRGDRNAFNLLVLRYQDGLYTLAYRIMGETQSAADAARKRSLPRFDA